MSRLADLIEKCLSNVIIFWWHAVLAAITDSVQVTRLAAWEEEGLAGSGLKFVHKL